MKQTNMMKLIGVVGVTTATAFMGVGEAHAISSFVLDPFTDNTTGGNGSNGLLVSGAGTDSGSATNVNSFNFDRSEDLTVTGTGGSDTTSTIASGELDVRLASSNFADTTLTYNNFSNFDFTQSGSNDLLRFTTNDASTTFFNTEVNVTFDDGTNSDNQTQSFSSSVTTLDFTFSSFSGVDFTSIDSVSYTIGNNTAGVNYRLDTPVTVTSNNPAGVPVPFEAETSIALALLGSWGAWKYWRRRKQQQVSFDNNEA